MGNLAHQHRPVGAATTHQIAEAYSGWATRFEEEGWTSYLLTFMFRQLAGGPSALARQMEREVERVYGRFVTRVVRNPRSAAAIGGIPIWICSPDYPVFKHAKQTLSDVTINDGRHMHAVHLQPPRSRLDAPVDEHFREQQKTYVRPDHALNRIHAVPITFNLKDVVDYVLKAIMRNSVTLGDVFVLPLSRTEMSTWKAH